MRTTRRFRRSFPMSHHPTRATRFHNGQAMKTRLAWIAAAMLVAIAAAVAPHLMSGSARYRDEPVTIAPAIGMPGAPPTSPDGLQRRIAETEARLREQPHDVGAAVLLADALLRRARATADSRGAGRARDVLKAVLQEQPAQCPFFDLTHTFPGKTELISDFFKSHTTTCP